MCSSHKAIFDGRSRPMLEVRTFILKFHYSSSFPCNSHTFPGRNDSWGRSAEFPNLYRYLQPWEAEFLDSAACLVWVFHEEERGQRANPPLNIGRSRRQLGRRNSSYQHIVPEDRHTWVFDCFWTFRHTDVLMVQVGIWSWMRACAQTGNNISSSSQWVYFCTVIVLCSRTEDLPSNPFWWTSQRQRWKIVAA